MAVAPFLSDSDYFNRNHEYLLFVRLTREEIRDLLYIVQSYPSLIRKDISYDDVVYVASVCKRLHCKLGETFRKNVDAVDWIR